MPRTAGTIPSASSRSVAPKTDLEQETLKFKQECDDATDNIFIAKKWLMTNMNMDKETVAKYFNIPEELDYVE